MPLLGLVVLFIFIGLFLAFVYFFLSRKNSPVPYFPSNAKDMRNIVNLLELGNKQIVYDLGAGDGAVIIAAAHAAHERKLTTRFVGVEINPILILVMKLRFFNLPNKQNIATMKGDMFVMDIPKTKSYSPTFFIYISPWYMEQTVANLARQYKSINLVTYFYALPKSKQYKMKLRKSLTTVHTAYHYTVTR